MDAVFQKLLSGHQIFDGRTDRTHASTDGRTGVTLNAPPPFFEWRGHKKLWKNCYNNTSTCQHIKVLSRYLVVPLSFTSHMCHTFSVGTVLCSFEYAVKRVQTIRANSVILILKLNLTSLRNIYIKVVFVEHHTHSL